LNNEWPVIDLFSGAGGMSCGFARRPPFRVVGAVDAEHGKPSSGYGTLGCNDTYEANIGIRPFNDDIAHLEPKNLSDHIRSLTKLDVTRGRLVVLSCCPPCTDFSRAKPVNHLVDSDKNSLVVRCTDFVEEFLPEFVVMENARELIMGRHAHHYIALVKRLEQMGYSVDGSIRRLSRYGLPQERERAIIIATRIGPVKTLDDLWQDWELVPAATTVRNAIRRFADPPLAAGEVGIHDPMHRSPAFLTEGVRRRIELVPHDGGSWYDISRQPGTSELLTPSMKDRLSRQDFGSHGDVYGRMAWDRPAPTVKRECGHVGNGRYAHPEQNRLLTVREMATIQGFPDDYQFVSSSLTNLYRHIGDAVPPLISYQLSAVVQWMKTGVKPEPAEWILPGTSLTVRYLKRRKHPAMQARQMALI